MLIPSSTRSAIEIITLQSNHFVATITLYVGHMMLMGGRSGATASLTAEKRRNETH